MASREYKDMASEKISKAEMSDDQSNFLELVANAYGEPVREKCAELLAPGAQEINVLCQALYDLNKDNIDAASAIADQPFTSV